MFLNINAKCRINWLFSIGRPEDGNKNDKTWNKELLEDFEKIKDIMPDIERNKPLYVADSALITATNLELLHKKQIPFVSRLPNTYGLIEELKTWAFAKNQWQEIGPLGKKKTMDPTANTVLEMLMPINIIHIRTSTGIERAVADNQLDGNILRLLKLAVFSESIYVTVKERLSCELG